jgi:penicillin-binding protein 1C
MLFSASLLIFVVFIYFYVFHDLPDVSKIEAGLALPSTRIYDRHGQLLYEILPPEQGRNRAIPLSEIPPDCVNALIAIEDANYWSHAGIDPVAILRAAWINMTGGEIIAGGSTITQQAARLLLLDPQQRAERTPRRKLREMVLAVRLQNQFSKDYVLELYLNQVYFGNLAYGIEGASQTYFHKSANELSVAECALLAGIVQNAVLHDPLTNLDSALKRQSVALDLMVQNSYITRIEADSAKRDELQFGSVRFPIRAPHFVMTVWQQLERDYPEALYHDGLDVITTMDLGWYETAEEIVNAQLAMLNHPLDGSVSANANNAAVVAIDPFTGQVLMMLGSPNYFDEEIDGAVNAALALRQPGSALKPFTYALAMNPDSPNPYTPATVLFDVETPFVTSRLESYTPANFALVEHGPVSVRQALGSSFNIPAVIALQQSGIENFVEFTANAGLDSLASNPNIDLAITLGGGEVRLIDMAQAYSIFPNGGFYIEPSFILTVTTREGDSLYEWQAEPLNRRVLDERVAFLINDILSDNEARIPSFGPNSALQIARPAAAKTGTTTDFRDNWVMAYTPNLVVGVWVGNADNTPMLEVTGVSGAGPIYNQFMRRVLVGQPELKFQRPDGLSRVEICTLSGLLPKENCPLRRVEWFVEGTEPTEYDHYYQNFRIDRRTGLLADENTPVEYVNVQTFVVLPREARDWAIQNSLPLPPEGALVDEPTIGLRLTEPDPYTSFEISPITPIETQRLHFTVATPQDTVSVNYYLNGERLGIETEAPFDLWWTLDIGEWELSAEATLSDSTILDSEPVPFSVLDYEPAQERTISADGN